MIISSSNGAEHRADSKSWDVTSCSTETGKLSALETTGRCSRCSSVPPLGGLPPEFLPGSQGADLPDAPSFWLVPFPLPTSPLAPWAQRKAGARKMLCHVHRGSAMAPLCVHLAH